MYVSQTDFSYTEPDEDSEYKTFCIDRTKELDTKDWDGQERLQIKNLLTGKKTNATVGIDAVKKEQLARIIAFPYVKKYLMDTVSKVEDRQTCDTYKPQRHKS